MPDTAKIPATLIPGDGIGPEITEAVCDVLDHMGIPFDWDVQQAGMAGIDATGDPLPDATVESIERTGLALKGPLTTPVGGGYTSVNIRLRRKFELFANVRPARTLTTGTRYDGVDLVTVRENLEGYYIAEEKYV